MSQPPEQTDPTLQLMQARVPLERAGMVFEVPDASGRTPIVVVPSRNLRVRVDLIGGAVALVLLAWLVLTLGWHGGIAALAVVGAVALASIGAMSAFFVRVPEGTTVLLIRSGRHAGSLEPGSHLLMPWIVVSHVVSRRRVPFAIARVDSPTRDNVGAQIDALLTFTIADPQRFVYSVAAPDFDVVLQAACQDAVRSMLRRLTWSGVLDIEHEQTEQLRAQVDRDVAAYGVRVEHLNVTLARPAADLLRSEEARQVAEMQRRIAELEADTHAIRLARLEDSISRYPRAADWERQEQQLEVARALATNTRAVVQLGRESDLGSAARLESLAAVHLIDDNGPRPSSGTS
jgi:regulator of protease activity HflC (stomatin/prohibitin superfamily)